MATITYRKNEGNVIFVGDTRDCHYNINSFGGLSDALQRAIIDYDTPKFGFLPKKIVILPKKDGGFYNAGYLTTTYSAPFGASGWAAMTATRNVEIEAYGVKFKMTTFIRNASDYQTQGFLLVGSSRTQGNVPTSFSWKGGTIDMDQTDHLFINILGSSTGTNVFNSITIELEDVYNYNNQGKNEAGAFVQVAANQQGIVRIQLTSPRQASISNCNIKITGRNTVATGNDQNPHNLVRVFTNVGNEIENLNLDYSMTNTHGNGVSVDTVDRSVKNVHIKFKGLLTKKGLATPWNQRIADFINRNRGGFESVRVDEETYVEESLTPMTQAQAAEYTNRTVFEVHNTSSITIRGEYVRCSAPLDFGYQLTPTSNIQVTAKFIECNEIGDPDSQQEVLYIGCHIVRMRVGSIQLGYGNASRNRIFTNCIFVDPIALPKQSELDADFYDDSVENEHIQSIFRFSNAQVFTNNTVAFSESYTKPAHIRFIFGVPDSTLLVPPIIISGNNVTGSEGKGFVATFTLGDTRRYIVTNNVGVQLRAGRTEIRTKTNGVLVGHVTGNIGTDLLPLDRILNLYNSAGVANVSLKGDTTNSYIVNGNIGFGTISPVSKVDINASGGNSFRVRNSFTPASTADATGSSGVMAWDDNYVYVKTSTGWKRSSLSTF
jgi:hypothetical protein